MSRSILSEGKPRDDFHRRALLVAHDSGTPFLVGGGHALCWHTGGADRLTSDLDLVVLPEDVGRLLDAFAKAGFRTEIAFPHWLAKGWSNGRFVDVIFGSGNGAIRVDKEWFDHAVPGWLLGVPVRFCPPEESIWTQSFVMERERYDGADVAHLLRACGRQLDWPRLVERFGANWQVLLAHLVLFGFIYPGERAAIPGYVLQELLGRLEAEQDQSLDGEPICRGTLLSRAQYQVDVSRRGYRDARVRPLGGMSETEAARWTQAARQGVRR